MMQDILGYEGLYAIYSDGRVYSHISGRYLSTSIGNRGYRTVTLSKAGKVKTLLVHRLVAEAFLPNPDNLPEINHIDEDKSNPDLYNLEWCTGTYNKTYTSGKAIQQLDLNGNVLMEYESIAAASRAIGTPRSGSICQCLKGTRKTAAGYRWRYKYE